MTNLASEKSSGYYHCLSCNLIFESTIQTDTSKKCSHCSQAATMRSIKKSNVKSSRLDPRQDTRGRAEGHKTNKRKRRLIYQAYGLFMLILLSFIGIKFGEPQRPKPEDLKIADLPSNLPVSNVRPLEDIALDALVHKSLNIIDRVFKNFLEAKSLKDKYFYIYKKGIPRSDFKRYYQNDVTALTDRLNRKIKKVSVIRKADPMVLGCIFVTESGELEEAQFIKNYDTWQLDWESYVRLNPTSWEQLLKSTDQTGGVYRVYIKKNAVGEQADKQESTLMLYPPKVSKAANFSQVTPHMVKIPKEGALEERMEYVLNQQTFEDEFYKESLQAIDPAGYQRMTVKLRSVKNEGRNSSIEIVDFISNHWYGSEIVD